MKGRLARFRQVGYSRDSIFMALLLDFSEIILSGYSVGDLQHSWHATTSDPSIVPVVAYAIRVVANDQRQRKRLEEERKRNLCRQWLVGLVQHVLDFMESELLVRRLSLLLVLSEAFRRSETPQRAIFQW